MRSRKARAQRLVKRVAPAVVVTRFLSRWPCSEESKHYHRVRFIARSVDFVPTDSSTPERTPTNAMSLLRLRGKAVGYLRVCGRRAVRSLRTSPVSDP